MASIYGFEVKGVKTYPDHEGVPVPYGNLYYEGKKMGQFRTDAWGGPMQYDHSSKALSEEEMKKKLLAIPSVYGWDKFFEDFDLIIDHLISFKDDESTFRKVQKKNRILFKYDDDMSRDVMASHLYINPIAYSIAASHATDDYIAELSEEVKTKQPGGVVTVYRKLEDFAI